MLIKIYCRRHQAVVDPDLQIRGGGGQSSRLWHKGGVVSKIFFRSFRPQFGLKIRGGQAPPLDPLLLPSIASTRERMRSKHVFTWRQTSEFQASNFEVFPPKRTEWTMRTPTLPTLPWELHIWAGKLQSLTPETQKFDVTWKHVLSACVHG